MTGMVPQDVYELTGVADPRLSPDGATVAYVVGRVDKDANEYRSAIWLAAADGSAPPRRFTSGEKSDADPRWSPDGTQLAFTSNRADKASQLYVMPVAGGEPRKLTSLKEDVTQAAWSPDGTTIAFVARVRDAAYEEEDDKKRAPRRHHAPAVQARQRGLDGRPAAAPVPGAGRRLGGAHAAHGRRLRGQLAGLVAGRADARVRLRPSRGLGPRDGHRRVPGGRRRRRAAAAHAGRRQHRQRRLAAGRPRLAVDRYPGVVRRPQAHQGRRGRSPRSGEITLLTASLDRNCTTYPGMREPLWNDGELVFVVEDHGRVHVYAVAADGSGEPRLLVGGEREVTGLDVAAGRLVFTASDPTHLSELYDGGPAAARTPAAAGTQLTQVGDAFAGGRELVRPERFTAVSADGSEVDAWIMRPAGYEEGKRYPTLLNIHGGPYGQYGESFFDEFQVYCGAGYAVVFSNPRGSSGSTEEWARAIRGPGEDGDGWGSVDYEDCMAVMDEAVRALRLRRRGPPRRHRRLLRRLHDLLDRRPHRPLQGGRLRARRQQLRLAVGLQRLRLGLQGLHRQVPLRGRGPVPQGLAGRPTRRASTRRC